MRTRKWKIRVFLWIGNRLLIDMTLPLYDKTFVESTIPQKHPFVMVDALLAFSETELKSGFTVPEDYLFVDSGVFQASGLLEHQAQSVALHTGFQYFQLQKTAPTGYIGSVKSFEVLELPKVGDSIETEVTILHEMMGVTLVNIVSKVNGKTIATSQMKTVLKD